MSFPREAGGMAREKVNTPEAHKDFLRELALLRVRVDEVAEQYGLGVKARIDEIVHLLAGTGAPEAGHVLPEPRTLEKLAQKMKKLTAKPQKGRAKDLKKIQDLVDALVSAMQAND
jgi:hypothetical protein